MDPPPVEPEKKAAAEPPARQPKNRKPLKPKLKKREKPAPAPRRSSPPPEPAAAARPPPAPDRKLQATAAAQTAETASPEPPPTLGERNPPAQASLPPAPKAAAILKEASPLYRANPAPRYPLSARRRGYQGTVILEVLVGHTGRVVDLRLAQSSGHGTLDDAALEAVRGWRFVPGTRDDLPVDMWVRVPVRFQLR
jgi:protein TonB